MMLLRSVWVVLLVSITYAVVNETRAGAVTAMNSRFTNTMNALDTVTDSLQLVASEGGVIADVCAGQIQSANEALIWVRNQLPCTPLQELANFFRSASKAVSACDAFLAMRADTLPVSMVRTSKKALVTMKEMLTQLASDVEAVVVFDRDVSETSGAHPVDSSVSSSNEFKVVTPSDLNDEAISGCTSIHPTNCQFSECGKGRRLPLCAFGYAEGVTGGLMGKSYVVTNNEDDHKRPSPGSLRYGVNQGGQANGGVWITFARSLEIRLTDLLWIKSGTTIDGRGFNVTITGRSMVLCGISNVILHNFQISGVGESDTVHIFAGSSRVWVDHLTSKDAKLGLVSVLQGSTDVTISNSLLSNYNFNMLLGASDFDKQDADMRVSVYRNWFKDSMQRMPHCRWGRCHVLNNLYTNWGYYALGARVSGKIYSESNAFVARRRSEITPWFNGIGKNYDNSIFIKSSKDVYLNGSTFHQFLRPNTIGSHEQNVVYKNQKMYPPVIPPETLNKVLPNCVGAVFGYRLAHCST